MLAEPAPANGDHVASHAARERFAALVLKNEDCRALFFDLFSPARGPGRTVSDFRRHGAPVSWTRGTTGTALLVDEFTAELGKRAGLACSEIRAVRWRGNSAQQMGRYGRAASRESVVMFNNG